MQQFVPAEATQSGILETVLSGPPFERNTLLSPTLPSEQKNIGARAPARIWMIYMSYETSQQMALELP